MIVYTIRNKKLNKIKLPEKVSGVYQITDDSNHILCNIEGYQDKWVLKNNNDIELSFNNQTVKDSVMSPYYLFSIKQLITNEVTQVIAEPLYDETFARYEVKGNRITIGAGNCDIQYNYFNKIKSEEVVLTKVDNHWVAENVSGSDLFLNDRLFKKRNMFHGDHLFIYGLRVIVVNNTVIVNNPMGYVKVGSNLVPTQVPDQTITYQQTIQEDTPLYTKDDLFFKSPRFRSVIEPVQVKISAPPETNKTEQNPAILQYGPRMTMVIVSIVSLLSSFSQLGEGKSIKSLLPQMITLGATMLTAFFWPTLTRKFQARRELKDIIKIRKKYLKYLEYKSKEIEDIKSLHKQILLENSTSLEECQTMIYNKNRNVFGRNIKDEDFLTIRLGTGTVDSQIEIQEPEEEFEPETQELKENMLDIIKESKTIENAPMNVSLANKKIVAVVGNNVVTKYFIDSMFLQLMTFHSYLDLKIIVITNKTNQFLWEYLKVLPHTWNNLKTMRFFATDAEELSDIAVELEKEFDERFTNETEEESNADKKVDDSNGASYRKYKPYYLIFIDDLELPRNSTLIKKILNTQNNFGYSIVYRNNRLSDLPEQCSTFINVDPEKSGLFETELSKESQKEFVPELNKTIDMYGCAQMLANVPLQKEKAKYELPSSLSFLEMFNVGKVEQLNSLDRWKTNNPVNSLSVPVGINQDGELFKMDAHEKGWGPHGLVAGMTGSGKSEWLVSYILSLAVNFHPDEVQFVIIDYKGGGLALAFENSEMGIKLPHLAGTITNLDKSAINRALTSIEAELKRRQELFNDAREKLHESSMNIYKYQNYYRKGLLDEPISHLFIISDEFAELKSQEPEFLDQLVSTARIGRSLGVHLILATQKPSGVVNEQIWSNSRFHVCLRVQDQSDSKEMIKTPDAAMLKTTGAFYMQVGFNEYYALGQSAWAGSKYHPSDIVKKKVDQAIDYIDTLGNVVNSYDENTFTEKQVEEDNGEELLNVVQYISNIAKGEKIVGKKLWLPNVDPNIMLDDIKKRYNWKQTPNDLHVAIGEYDRPAKQEQGLFVVNMNENIAIYGENGAGKENLLATLIWSGITEHTPDEVNFYLIDFGAETLRMFAKYPHVGEVVFQDNIDGIAGILEMMGEEIDKRKELFADYNGNYESYIKETGNTLPRWVVVINAYDVFSESLMKIMPVFESLYRDAPKVGITFILSATGHQTVRNKVADNFPVKLILHLSDDAKYRIIEDKIPKKLIPANEFGRGLAVINDDKEWCEFQTAFICERSKINTLVRSNADRFSSYYKTHAKSLPKIPDDVTSEELSNRITTLEAVPVGYAFHEKEVKTFNFAKDKLMAICTSDYDKNMESLVGIINVLAKVPGTKVRVYDINNSYKGDVLDILYYNENIDATLVALTNDLEKRTTQQDYGITFILGISKLKNKLNIAGKEYYTKYFDALVNANQSGVVIVDSYENMKKLKIENWFTRLNTSNCIWLGNGIENQNIFNVNAIDMEDRKLKFNGIAFTVEEGSYTLIKSVMDKE